MQYKYHRNEAFARQTGDEELIATQANMLDP